MEPPQQPPRSERKFRYQSRVAPSAQTLAAGVLTVREEPESDGSSPQPPKFPFRFLVLEEHDQALYNATRALTEARYKLHTVPDEERAATKILASKKAHFLLLTAQHSEQPLRVPQLIARLRQRHYDQAMSYCARGNLLPTTQAAYEALTVNRVLVLPARAQGSVLDSLAWLAGQIALDSGGLVILET